MADPASSDLAACALLQGVRSSDRSGLHGICAWKFSSGYAERKEAHQLGIEALKEVKASREEDYIGDTGLLPGETEK